MADKLSGELCALAERQCGMLTGRQLCQQGVTRSAVHSRVRQGRWQRIHRGVYATFSGPPSRDALLRAAVLCAGPGARLSYSTAAEAGGLTDKPSELIHITVPWDRRVARTPGIVVHRSSRASRAVHPTRLPPQTRLEETVLDLADVSRSLNNAVGWLARSLQRRLTMQARLRSALELRTKLNGAI